MFLRGSRYEDAIPFAAPGDGRPAFRGVRPRAIGPARGVIEHRVAAGERPELLARHYYDDERRWWRILDANPEVRCGGDLLRDPAADGLESRVGRAILIPKAEE